MAGAAAQAASNTSAGSALPCRAPTGEADCPEGVIRLGIFFDGTNNNMFRDWGATHDDRMSGNLSKPEDPDDEPDVNAPSNVAKLYELFREQPIVQKKVYLIGIGAGSEKSKAGSGGNRAAQGTGAGGTWRIEEGIRELTAFVNTSNHQKAIEKRVDVFGFSRGAAQSRDFVNKVFGAGIDNTKDWNGEYKTEYVNAGRTVVAVRVKAYKRTTGILLEFLGVFDTVASFGLGAFAAWGNAGFNFNVPGRPAKDKKTPDEVLAEEVVKEKEQWVHRTFHAIAEDEYREMFPIELIGLDPKEKGYLRLPKYVRERPYPGCHSDVGGGYRFHPGKKEGAPKLVPVGDFGGFVEIPGDPAIPPKDPYLCNIPLEDMHAEALLGHVPLNPICTLPESIVKVPPEMRKLYDKYLGEREALFRKHLKTPLLANYINSVTTDPVYLQAIPEDIFQAIQKERLVSPGYQALATGYIHDSNTGALWGITGFLKRITNWTRTFKSQRGVTYGAPQNSYDPESSKVNG